MRKPLLLLFMLVFCTLSKAQHSYAGLSADYNSGIGEKYTYGLGLHVEMQVTNCENLYFNWHYTLGYNTHNEFYAHAGLPVLLYNSQYWWDMPVDDWGGLVALIFGPIACPSGMTYYLPVRNKCKGDRYRFGIYCNPIALDFWDQSPRKVTSWTVESGAKCIIETRSDLCFYVAGGVSFTNNLRRGGGPGYGDETLIQLQLGILHAD